MQEVKTYMWMQQKNFTLVLYNLNTNRRYIKIRNLRIRGFKLCKINNFKIYFKFKKRLN